MRAPRISNSSASPDPSWYFSINGQSVEGPVSVEGLEALYHGGTITDGTWVAMEGSNEWCEFSQVFSVTIRDEIQNVHSDVSQEERFESRVSEETMVLAASTRNERQLNHAEQDDNHSQERAITAKNRLARRFAWGGGAIALVLAVATAIGWSRSGTKNGSEDTASSPQIAAQSEPSGVHVGANVEVFYEVLGKQNISKSFNFEGRSKTNLTYLIFDADDSSLVVGGFDRSDVAKVVVCMRRDERGGVVSLGEDEIQNFLVRFSRSGKPWVKMNGRSGSDATAAWADTTSISRNGDGVMAHYDADAEILVMGSPKEIERALEDLSRSHIEDLSEVKVRRADRGLEEYLSGFALVGLATEEERADVLKTVGDSVRAGEAGSKWQSIRTDPTVSEKFIKGSYKLIRQSEESISGSSASSIMEEAVKCMMLASNMHHIAIKGEGDIWAETLLIEEYARYVSNLAYLESSAKDWRENGADFPLRSGGAEDLEKELRQARMAVSRVEDLISDSIKE